MQVAVGAPGTGPCSASSPERLAGEQELAHLGREDGEDLAAEAVALSMGPEVRLLDSRLGEAGGGGERHELLVVSEVQAAGVRLGGGGRAALGGRARVGAEP